MTRFRGLLLVVCLLMLAWNASAGTVIPLATDGVPPTSETALFQWAVTQGGLVVVVLVVVWSYRRDFSRLFASERQKSGELMIALQQSTAAIATHAEMMRDQTLALREQARAFSDLSGSVQTCKVVRDIIEGQRS